MLHYIILMISVYFIILRNGPTAADHLRQKKINITMHPHLRLQKRRLIIHTTLQKHSLESPQKQELQSIIDISSRQSDQHFTAITNRFINESARLDQNS